MQRRNIITPLLNLYDMIRTYDIIGGLLLYRIHHPVLVTQVLARVIPQVRTWYNQFMLLLYESTKVLLLSVAYLVRIRCRNEIQILVV